MIDQWSVGCQTFELLTGDLLFDPTSGDDYDKEDGNSILKIDHLAQMMELLGRMPRSFTQKGRHARDFFNAKGQLRSVKQLNKVWPLKGVLEAKYGWPPARALEAHNFIIRFLAYQPNERIRPDSALLLPWIKDVNVDF